MTRIHACVLVTVVLGLPAVQVPGQVDRDLDLDAVRRAARAGRRDLPEIERRFFERLGDASRAPTSFRELLGYSPPGRALKLAYLHAFLWRQEHRPADARDAAGYLVRMADYVRRAPPALRRARPEYARGLPPVPSFFHLRDYATAYAWIRDADVDAGRRRRIEDALARSAEFVFSFPEWGAHNRAILRADGLVRAALALPDHALAPRWRRMAEILAADSIERWEIEDAQLYHPVWLAGLLSYAEAAGDRRVLDSPQVRYYLRYFQELLSPAGIVPDFGDAWWGSSSSWYYLCLERGAAELRDPALRWAAARVWRAMGPFDRENPPLDRALLFARLHPHLDPDLPARRPPVRSGPVLDDVVGKKIVLRSGREATDFYLLLNYRDEGDWGVLQRDFLRQTLAVEQEKAHHGHADENAIVAMMDGGSVLLHDAGYRDRAPSGPFGAYRADIFHNRVVVRRGRPDAGQDLFSFLADSGAYRRVRTQLVDSASLLGSDYSRTRVIDEDLGHVWDRTLVRLPEARAVVVFDTLEVTRDGFYTVSALWAVQEILRSGPGFVLGATTRIGEREFPRRRALLLVQPDAPRRSPPSFPLRRHGVRERVVHRTLSGGYSRGRFLGLVTVLWSVPYDTDAERLARAVRVLPTSAPGRAWCVTIRHGGTTTTIGLRADLRLGLRAEDVRPRYDSALGSVRYGDSLETDAELVVVRRRSGATTWGASGITRVVVDGRVVHESPPAAFFQTWGRADRIGRARWRRWEGVVR